MTPEMIEMAQLTSTLLGAATLILTAAFITAVHFYDRAVRRKMAQFGSAVEGLDGRQIPSMGFDGPFHPGA